MGEIYENFINFFPLTYIHFIRIPCFTVIHTFIISFAQVFKQKHNKVHTYTEKMYTFVFLINILCILLYQKKTKCCN